MTLNVDQGEKIVIIGPSGSGKSRLIRCMNQLEKVNDGSLVIDNIDISKRKAPIQKVRHKVAMGF
ncbi:ATP-binding cassette domain-containing protein, partial [Enterococcus faecalis]|uniref:ATP-binding cassette domain-containing protein n=1 Tax=Enterococcus faecalis TaxID=1351 RepID=UPI003D6B0611